MIRKIREHAWPVAVAAALTIVGGAATTGAVSLADARYVLLGAYTVDQVSRGVLTVDMQIRQVDYRLRDAARELEGAKGNAWLRSQAEADRVFYTGEKEALLRRRSDLLRER